MNISILEWDISHRVGRQITMVDGFASCFKSLGHKVKVYSNFLSKYIEKENFLEWCLAENLSPNDFCFDYRIERRTLGKMPIDEWSRSDMLLIPYPGYSWLGKYVRCPLVSWFIAQSGGWNPNYIDRIWTNSYTTKKRLSLSDARVIYPPHDYTPFRKDASPFDKRPIDILLVTSLIKNREHPYLLSEIKEADKLAKMGFNVLGIFAVRTREESKLAQSLSFKYFLNIKRKYIAEFMKKSKILFHPSPLESCSLVIFEALNAGCYPIVRQAGACKEQLGNIGYIYTEFREVKKQVENILRKGYDIRFSIRQGIKFDRKTNIETIQDELRIIRERKKKYTSIEPKPISFKELFKVNKFQWFIFFMSNYCNLHCEYCTSLCNIPLKPDSPYIFRRERYEINIDDVVLFCERFKGVGESDYIRLTGGEATVVPPTKIERIIDVVTSYHRPIWLMTNGFGLLGINKKYLNKINRITLDDHGINHSHILDCARYLRSFYEGKINIVKREIHYNVIKAREHSYNKGKRCYLWMASPVLYDRVVYPCCNLHFIEAYNKNTKMREELTQAGWTIDNPNIIETLKNWKETVPAYVVEQCLNHCWRPDTKVGGSIRITSKKNDVIKKELSICQ